MTCSHCLPLRSSSSPGRGQLLPPRPQITGNALSSTPATVHSSSATIMGKLRNWVVELKWVGGERVTDTRWPPGTRCVSVMVWELFHYHNNQYHCHILSIISFLRTDLEQEAEWDICKYESLVILNWNIEGCECLFLGIVCRPILGNCMGVSTMMISRSNFGHLWKWIWGLLGNCGRLWIVGGLLSQEVVDATSFWISLHSHFSLTMDLFLWLWSGGFCIL